MFPLKASKQQTAKYYKTNKPLQLLRFRCAITRGIKYIGGTK